VAKTQHERAKDRVLSASAAVELLAANIPEAHRKAETLELALSSGAAAELATAEDEERRLQAALLASDVEAPHEDNPVSPSSHELRDAEDAVRLRVSQTTP
jgi:hypothetical protein